jgi:hypothetical protein
MMSDPKQNEGFVEYVNRIQEEDKSIPTIDIINNYKKFNTNHIWLQ